MPVKDNANCACFLFQKADFPIFIHNGSYLIYSPSLKTHSRCRAMNPHYGGLVQEIFSFPSIEKIKFKKKIVNCLFTHEAHRSSYELF